MRNAVAIVVLLAVVALGAFLLLRGGGSPAIEGDAVDSGQTPAGAAPREKPSPTPTGLAGTSKPRRPASPDGGAIRGEGSLRATLRSPDGGPLPDAAVPAARFDIDRVGASLSAYPLALAQGDGTWLYEALPVGTYRVRAVVPGFRTATETVEVKQDDEASLTITLAPGVEIPWKATLYSGEPPSTVRIALLDGRGQAVAFDLQTGTGLVRVLPSTVIDLAPQGRIVGLAPGVYRLRATSPSGESDEQTVDAKEPGSASIELKIRK